MEILNCVFEAPMSFQGNQQLHPTTFYLPVVPMPLSLEELALVIFSERATKPNLVKFLTMPIALQPNHYQSTQKM